MSANPKATALRHALRHNGQPTCYSTGRLVVLVLGARERDGRIEGYVFEHQCGSAGAAHKVAERVFQVWRAFPYLSPQRALSETAARVAAERWVAMRRMGWV